MDKDNAPSEAENQEAPVPAEKEVDTTVPEAETPEEHTPESVHAETEKNREEPEERDDRTVPYGALHEERQRRREEAQRRKELEDKWAKAEERLETLMSRFQQPSEDLPAFEPDYDEDPIEYMRYKLDSLDGKLSERQQAEQEQARRQQEQLQQQDKVQRYRSAAQAFAAKTPDFSDAYQHYIQNRRQALAAMGFTGQDVDNRIYQEEMQIIENAERLSEDPAEMVYHAARANGYQPKTKKEADEKIDRINEGQKAAKSLSSAGGKTTGELTLESLARMDDDEFANLSDKEFRKIMGG